MAIAFIPFFDEYRSDSNDWHADLALLAYQHLERRLTFSHVTGVNVTDETLAVDTHAGQIDQRTQLAQGVLCRYLILKAEVLNLTP